MPHQKSTRPASVTRLTEPELLAIEFTSSDPESLENLSDDPPPEEEWEVEYTYDMTDREVKVRCVFCRYLNHYNGVVIRYRPSGARRLVGRDCALTRYGIEFERQLMEFDAAHEHQSYVRQRRALFARMAEISEEFRSLRDQPTVHIHDALWRTWRGYFADLSRDVGELAKRGEPLVVNRLVRDEAAERARKEVLGDKFESERQKAKAEGRRWQLTKTIQHVIGPVAGGLFFVPGIPIAKRLEEIQTEVQRCFKRLAKDDLTTGQIKAAFAELAIKTDQIKQEFDRLDGLHQAFHPDNLRRIAAWANEIDEEKDSREALFESRQRSWISVRYRVEGTSIIDSWRSGVRAALPYYRVPKRTLVDVLTEAISTVAEPARPGLSRIRA